MTRIILIALLITTGFLIGCSDDENPIIAPPDDTIAPAAITDLTALNPTGSSVMLIFTAPGDDLNLGRADAYDIRYSTAVINEANFDAASQFDTIQQPNVGTTTDTIFVTGLVSMTTYYFAVKTADEADNLSTISNIVSLTTLQSGTWTIYNSANSPIQSDTVTHILADMATRYYATPEGVIKQQNNDFVLYDTTLDIFIDTIIDTDTTIDTTTILPSLDIPSIDLDDAGTLWIGMTQGGLVRLIDSSTYELYDSDNSPLVLNSVNSVAIADSQNIWLATPGNGLFHFDGDTTWTHYLAIDGLQNNFLNKLALDEHGNLWISYNFGGATYYDGVDFTTYNASNGLNTLGVTDIMPLPNDRVLFGTEDGVFIKEPTGWTWYTTVHGLIDNVVLAVAEDANGNQWFGTRFGLMKKSGNVWTTFTTANSFLPDNYIYDISVDFVNNIVIGTNNGVAIYSE